MIVKKSKTHSLRIDPDNPDHHLYRNNGTWWIHYTRHLPDYTIQRVRYSLRTKDRVVAHELRDSILDGLFEKGEAA
ncbi:MAG: hypothetical protein AB3N33_02805 [Puniceicoccaceae bacterium]